MSAGSDALRDVYRRLDWANGKHDDMLRVFEDYLKPGGGDERPCGISYEQRDRPQGLVVARFIIDQPMPDAMSLLAADLVHNTRTALDHILARLKEQLGGDPGEGYFPARQSQQLWDDHVINARKGPLDGMAGDAVDLIYNEQPLHRAVPAEDPLVILNALDNRDKHEELSPAFVYTGAARGVDLIDVVNPCKLDYRHNLWTAGMELRHDTPLARYFIKGDPQGVLRANDAARLGFATGKVGAARTGYMTMIDRVRDIANKAERLIDTHS